MSAEETSPGLSRDLGASLVVFLVALPLSLGIAVASGAPSVRAGLVAAIVGGIVVGLFGGAPLQVSGPAAGLTVMVYGYIQQLGFQATCAAAILAGMIQVAAGMFGFARAALAISPAVLQAMLAGIGVLISLGQVHVLFGANAKPSALANLAALPESLSNVNVYALAVGLTTLATLLLWNKLLAKRVRVVPGSLVAIAAGTALSLVLPGELPLVTIPDNVIGAFDWPALGDNRLGDIVIAALGLAFVASCESLLCAVATDQLHSGPRARLNRELVGQGVGNVLSGALGGLPITGVIVRSSANISAGARSKYSAILHGLWMALFVALFAGFLRVIPLAALAALLVHVGVHLVKIKELKKALEFGEVLVYAATLLGVVFINLLWGIGIGFGLALALLMRKLTHVDIAVEERGDALHATLSGHLSFLAVPGISHELGKLPPKRTVHLALEVDQLDHAAIEAIRAWRVGYESAGGKVVKQPLDQLWRELTATRNGGAPQSA